MIIKSFHVNMHMMRAFLHKSWLFCLINVLIDILRHIGGISVMYRAGSKRISEMIYGCFR